MAATTNPRAEARSWCFTLNNPKITADELVALLEPLEVRYLVFQLEVGDSGTPHFQGYVVFKNKKRLSPLTKAILPSSAHWSVAKAGATKNRDYCTKPPRIGEFREFGEFPEKQQGARSDLVEVQSALKAGLTNKDYCDGHFDLFVRYPNLVSNYNIAQIEPREDGCEIACMLIIGPPGTGKSRAASHIASRLGFGEPYRHDTGKWFDGYRGERLIILDDFRGSCLSFTDFKRLVDRYALRVQVKGSTCPMAATHFIITSTVEPTAWWKEEVTGGVDNETAITRRITEVVYFPENGRFCQFDSYSAYARRILTPLRDGETYHPPQTSEYDYDA